MSNTNASENTYERLLDSPLKEFDPAVQSIIDFEAERQREKLILIASESICPLSVREALASEFSNLYAEGYPSERMVSSPEDKLLDFEDQLSSYRRNANRRYYKGCEYADLIESLAIRRAAEIFATPEVPAEKIFVNVQPLSGAAANNAVYEAFTKPGDTVLGMVLAHGGHLTHGSPVNRSGKHYQIVSYGVSQKTGRIDYEEIRQLTETHRPRMIIAGYSAYPWHVDWKIFRKIADSVDAILMADMSHYAGLVVSGDYPNPVGIADVTTLTTHKTLCGPRGAIILTTDPQKAKAIDFSVFPGEQGGPHLNSIAGRAVAFKIAATPEFRDLQHRVVRNCKALATGLENRGLKIGYEGTETHLCLLDLRSVNPETKTPLRGEMASRLLDLCGITVNKNTIAGDKSAIEPNGIRLGSTWITQRGLDESDMDTLAGLIHRTLTQIRRYSYSGPKGFLRYGAKMPFEIIEEVQAGVAQLVDKAEPGCEKSIFGYPHYAPAERKVRSHAEANSSGFLHFEITGKHAWAFLQNALTHSLSGLEEGGCLSAKLLDEKGEEIDSVSIQCRSSNHFLLQCSEDKAARVHRWLSLLSDGYVVFDSEDLLRTLDGPIVIHPLSTADLIRSDSQKQMDETKPFYIGQQQPECHQSHSKKQFEFIPDEAEPKHTCLYDVHHSLTSANRIIPFGGWAMPVCYDRTSIAEEHHAVRNTAALFDVTHMGILEFSGPGAGRFLDLVTTNEVSKLKIGKAQYSFLLEPDGQALDDITLYRLEEQRYMMVVNASNTDKVEAWLRGVNDRQWIIDSNFQTKEVDATAVIRNLKDSECGADQRVDLALQGPHSQQLLSRLIGEPEDSEKLGKLGRFAFMNASLKGIEIILSKTGYTGEKMGYELYVHPEEAVNLWNQLLETGSDLNVIPAGLGARDSTRIEAGFPLYGHELVGPYSISPIEAGYPYFVKLNKSWFIGRSAMVIHREARTKQIVRFKVTSEKARAVRAEDPVSDENGHTVGHVTSCTRIGPNQIGLAYMERAYRKVKSTFTIQPQPRTKREEARIPESIQAEVLKRFL